MDEIRVGGEAFKLVDPSYEPYTTKFNTIPKELGVPEFWLTVIQNHQNLSSLVEEHDEEALMYLIDITLEYTTSEDVPKSAKSGAAVTYSAVASGPAGKYRDGGNGYSRGSGAPSSSPSSSGSNVKPDFKLLFHFCQNPFFYNNVLEKVYIYKVNTAPYSGEGFVFSHADGTIIQWKSGDQNLTKIRDTNSNDHKPSFFNFFSPPPSLSESQIEQGVGGGGKVESEEFEELLDAMDSDLQAGEAFKDDVSEAVACFFFLTESIWISRLCRGRWNTLLTRRNGTKRIMVMMTPTTTTTSI